MPGFKNVKAPKKIHLEALSGARQDAYRRALDAVSLKRRNPALTLSKAAKQSGTTLRTVRKYANSALELRSGRADVKPSDRLVRHMRMLTDRGEVAIRVTSSRAATRISRYNNAVREFYATLGDTSALKPFQGKSIRTGGNTYEFVTDPATLNRLARAGAVHFLDIYVSENGR